MARPSPSTSRSIIISAGPNVQRGLGALNSRKNPKEAARCFFEAAQLYEMIGMTKERDAALREADKLYKT
jgi:hypothetical protein